MYCPPYFDDVIRGVLDTQQQHDIELWRDERRNKVRGERGNSIKKMSIGNNKKNPERKSSFFCGRRRVSFNSFRDEMNLTDADESAKKALARTMFPIRKMLQLIWIYFSKCFPSLVQSSVKTDLMEIGANSTLLVAKINKTDSGNYTCSIGESQQYTVLVHVLNGKKNRPSFSSYFPFHFLHSANASKVHC